MGDGVHCLRPGYLSALQWPSFLAPSSSTPHLICERDPEDVPGILQQGPRGWLPSQQLPSPAWLAPEDLQKPFTPQSRVEDGLKHYAAHHAEEPVPRPLLRELLGEAMAVGQLAAGVNLLGSRLAAARAGGRLVIASACGAIGEELSVVILADAGSPSGEFQCVGRMRAACAGMPIQQLCFSGPARPDQGPLLLAARAHSWLCFHEVVSARQAGMGQGSPSADGWELRAVGALQTRQRVAHVAWNRCMPGLAAFVLEDGSLYTVDAQPTLQVVQQGGPERMSIGMAGGTYLILRPDMLAGPPAALPGARRSRLLCEWTAHPTGLLLAAGTTLQRHTLRRPGQAACAPRVLHRLAPDDAFVALACPASPDSCGAYFGGQSGAAPHLLAASTLREVLLLDLRRPGRALLKWAHGQSRDPPALLALQLTPPSAPGMPDASSGPDPEQTGPGARSPHQEPAQREHRAAPGAYAAPSDTPQRQQPVKSGALELRAEDILHSQYGSSSQLSAAEAAPPTAGQAHGSGRAGAPGTQASQAAAPSSPALASQAQPQPPSTAGDDAGAGAGGSSTREPTGNSSCPQGFIVAGSIASGDVLSFAFSLAAPEVRLCRAAAASSRGAGQATTDPVGAPASQVSVQRLGPGAGRHAEPDPAATTDNDGPWGSRSRGDACAEGAAGFRWAPLNLGSARSVGLPRRVCWPLAQLSGEPPGLQGAHEPEQARELEAVLRSAPDLAGMALLPAPHPVLPWPAAAGGDSGQQPQGREGSGSMLLLRLGFLGDVAVDCIRTPWEMRVPRREYNVPGSAASLGSLLGPRHAGAVPEYTIRCLPDQGEPRSSEPSLGLQASASAQGRPGKSADLSGLICDVSVHRSIAVKAARSWAAALSAGPREDPPAVQGVLQRLLAELQARTQVPLTVWEVTQELMHLRGEAGTDNGASALQRRVRSVRRGAPAAAPAGGTDGGGGAPLQPRMALWQKARGTDPANIAGERLRAAHGEPEGTLGLPGSVASAGAALAALLAPGAPDSTPSGSAAMPAIGPAPGAACALRGGLCLPLVGRAAARHAAADAPAAEGLGLGSQATTASQPPTAQAAQPLLHGPLVDPKGWSGCGSVLVPMQPVQRMFGGVASGSPAQEPRLIMGPVEAGDATALKSLTALEEKWFTYDREQGFADGAAAAYVDAPVQEPAYQPMQAAPRPQPQQQEGPHQAQQRKAHAAPSPTATPPPRPKRPAKKRRTVLQEGFS